jgi:hypothetical protein
MKAVLKKIVDLLTLLIGAEGTRLLRDQEASFDPAGAKASRRLQGLPAESECPERKSTAKFNTAKMKEAALWTASFISLSSQK